MAVTTVNSKAYGKLLAVALPKAIDTRAEFDRCVAMMEALDRRDDLSPEEEALRALLEQLVAAYDEKVKLPAAPPHEVIRYLMEHNGLRQADLVQVFGSRSVASDVLAGKREPSKAHIRALAEFFRVPAGAFLSL